ncbi:hypothetical protein AB0N16_01715 [Streptomyces sp. NPDC051105]|uniref:hypothetical protein n=1 Tax=Streptomyces sp. NPDC051105 TaxID=3154843 RepID=UPI003431DF4A
MTSAPRTTRHRRVHAFRKPAIAALADAGLLADAWYATAGAATTADLEVTSTAVTLSAKYPYLSAGYNNSREWNRTATAVAPDGTLRVAWPAADGVHVTQLTAAGKRPGADTVVKGAKLSGDWSWGCSHNEGIALHAETSGAFGLPWKSTRNTPSPSNRPASEANRCPCALSSATGSGRSSAASTLGRASPAITWRHAIGGGTTSSTRGPPPASSGPARPSSSVSSSLHPVIHILPDAA